MAATEAPQTHDENAPALVGPNDLRTPEEIRAWMDEGNRAAVEAIGEDATAAIGILAPRDA